LKSISFSFEKKKENEKAVLDLFDKVLLSLMFYLFFNLLHLDTECILKSFFFKIFSLLFLN